MNSSSLTDLTRVPAKQLLRKTEVFGLVYRIDQALRANVTFEQFKRNLGQSYAAAYPEDDPPSAEALHHLYERAIDAKTDRLWVRKVKAIAGSTAWKTHSVWLGKAIRQLQDLATVLEPIDNPRLPEHDARRIRSFAQSTRSLRRRLLEIQRWDKRLDDIARVRNRNSTLRQARVGMDRTLRNHCPGLNEAQRVELIRLAVEAVGLKGEDTTDAVGRQLRRVRVRSVAKTAKPGRRVHKSPLKAEGNRPSPPS